MSNNHYNKAHSFSGISEVTVREANGADTRALERLAQLDSSTVPAAPVIVAVLGGEIRAAASMRDGTAIADPFRPTAGLVAMLRMRAGYPVEVAGSPIKAIGRSFGGRSSRDPRVPAPSAPAVPGIPTAPGHAA
jgi:hypothetical protein